MKKGQVYVGLLASEDKEVVTLKAENDALRVLARKDIDTIEVIERSMMPEGLDKNMTVQDFRDLIRYVMASPFLTDVEIAAGANEARFAPLAVGVPGRIALPVHKEGQAKALIRARFTAPAAMTTRLLLGGGLPLKVTLNGAKVFDGVAGTGTGPDQAAGT